MCGAVGLLAFKVGSWVSLKSPAGAPGKSAARRADQLDA